MNDMMVNRACKKDPRRMPLHFIALAENSLVGLYAGWSDNPALEYSLDNKTWQAYDLEQGMPVELPNIGDKVYFRGDNDALGGICFYAEGAVEAAGNIMSLLDKTCALEKIEAEGAFSELFYGCSGLLFADKLLLPATELSAGCYYYMFSESGIRTAPRLLPAEFVPDSAYYGMFQSCMDLETAPVIMAKGIDSSGCAQMFELCQSLTAVQPALFTEWVGSFGCGAMYSGSNIETPPELPATRLGDAAYYAMFGYCLNLKSIPRLEASLVDGYAYCAMFMNCPQLTEVTLTMPAEYWGMSSHMYMFGDCAQLNKVTVDFTEWGDADQTGGWLEYTAEEGTFVCPSALPEIRDNSHIPEGWTIIRT